MGVSTETGMTDGSDRSRRVFSVRDMAPGDIPAVLVVEQASFPRPWTVGMFEGEFEHARSWRRVVVDELDRVVGFLLARYYGDTWHVMDLAVLPEERRGGLGGLLVDDLLARVAPEATIQLEVRSGNSAALSLYVARGFRQVGLRRGYYDDEGEDAVVMAYGEPAP